MDERKVNIDELFRRQMGEKADTPPEAVWDALEKRLDAPAPVPKRPFPVWWYWAIGGLLLISATAIVAGYRNAEPPAIVNSKQEQATPVKQTVTDEYDVSTATTSGSIASDNVVTYAENKNTKPAPEASNATPELLTTKKSTAIKNDNEKQFSPEGVKARKVRIADEIEHAQQGTVQFLAGNTTGNTNVEVKPVALPVVTTSRRDELSVLNTNTPVLTTSSVSSYQNIANKKAVLPDVVKVNDEVSRLTALNTVQQPYSVNLNKPAGKLIPVPELTVPVTEDNYSDRVPMLDVQKNIGIIPVLPAESLIASSKQYAAPLPGKAEEQAVAQATVTLNSVNDDANVLIPNASLEDAKTEKNESQITVVEGEEVSEPLVKTSNKVPLPFEMGIKAGYSMGFNNDWRANKLAIAPYIEYRATSKISLTFQPTYHTGNAKTGNFHNADQYFYEIKNNSFDSSGRVVRGVIDSTVVTANPPDTVYRTYTYTQTYDSVHVKYGVTQSNLWDIELPLIAKYHINDRFAIMVGGSATYSSVLQTKEEVNRYSLKQEYVNNIAPETFYVTYQGQQAPEGPQRQSFEEVFSHTGVPYSNYTPRSVMESSNFFRYGFMIGASATFKERLMIELMLHKTGVDANAVPDKDLQRLYNQPYLRLMVGYKLFKQ